MLSRSQLGGALYGLLVGDALGVPYEFHDPRALPPRGELEMSPPAGFPRSHPSAPPGTWSDDGSLALALLSSLLDRGDLDLDHLARAFLSWYERGAFTPDGRVFDVGIATSSGLRAFAAGVPAERAGGTDERSNGNGSLMRVLPLALWHAGPDLELVLLAHRQGLPTHGHPRSQVCCAALCLAARRLAAGSADAWGEAFGSLRALYAADPALRPFADELEAHVRPDDDAPARGSGYVVDTLRSARWALDAGGYEDVVRAAISLGNDTDTTACVAGGLAGLRDGVEAIPRRWLDALQGKDLVEPLLERLVARAARGAAP